MGTDNLETRLLTSGCSACEVKDSKQISATPLVLFSTIIIVCGTFNFGFAFGYSTAAMPSLMEDLKISVAEFSLFGSLLTLGAGIASLVCGKIAGLYGRRFVEYSTLWLADIFCITGWLAIAFARDAVWLDIGRLLLGIGAGFLSYTVPIYIAEITPKDSRGSLTFSTQNCGLALAFFSGNYLRWRLLAPIGVISCLIQVVGLFFIPESPRWLANVGRDRDFEVALQALRGENADISLEAADIRSFIGNYGQDSQVGILGIFRRKYARQLTVGIGLLLLQQLSGSAAVVFYASSIFKRAGFSTQTGTAVLSFFMVPKALLGLLLVDRWGRKPLLLASAAAMCSACLLLSLSFGLHGLGRFNHVSPVLSFVGVLVYILAYAVGLGGLPWIIMSEIFPINMKVSAGSVATSASWASGWIVTYAFNFMLQWSPPGTFVIFSVICGGTVVFAWSLVPETKGQTLEEIQASFTHTMP